LPLLLLSFSEGANAIHVVKDPAYIEMFSFGIYDIETLAKDTGHIHWKKI
jgi:hypothetical protein